MEKNAMSATLLIVVLLHSLLWLNCSGLTCQCSTTNPFTPDPYLGDCIRNGGMCTGDICSVSRYSDQFGEETVHRCLDLGLSSNNVAICDGSSNNENAVHECCTDSDFCNADLHPLFPSEMNTQPPSPTPSDITSPPPSITLSPSPSSTTKLPTEDVIRCFCDSTQGSQSSQTQLLCLEDRNEVHCTGRCYQKRFLADDNIFHTEWSCFQADDPQMEMLCNGDLDTEDSIVKCCDEDDLCNVNLILPTTETPTEPPTLRATTDLEVSAGVLSPGSGLTSKHYYIISAVVVIVGIVTVGGILLVFVFVYLHSRQQTRRRTRTKQSGHPTVLVVEL